jgi:dodecin
MAKLVKVIEVLAQSDKSWEDAAQQAVGEASNTLRNIRSIYIKEFEGQSRVAKSLNTASTRKSHSTSKSREGEEGKPDWSSMAKFWIVGKAAAHRLSFYPEGLTESSYRRTSDQAHGAFRTRSSLRTLAKNFGRRHDNMPRGAIGTKLVGIVLLLPRCRPSLSPPGS